MEDKAILYIHGKNGNSKEADGYKKYCPGFSLIGIDYKDDYPWIVKREIREAYEEIQKEYKSLYIIANSIGCYFSMLAFQDKPIEKALFISPIVNMEKLILNMMKWAKVSEDDLKSKKEIKTSFGETLSWEYLSFTRNNPIKWNVKTNILFGEKDALTTFDIISDFAKKHAADITIMKNGEHYFHTNEQMEFLYSWIDKHLI